MWLIIATVLMALAIIGILVLKAMGRSVMNKPSWKDGIISGLLEVDFLVTVESIVPLEV